MKTLYLVRHAKSSWDLSDLPDIDRPLNERGYRDAHLIGKQLLEKSAKPDLIISSPAIRAVSTALIIARGLSYSENKIKLRKDLYDTSAGEYVSEISKIDDDVKCLMLFGHNPIISQTAEFLLHKDFKDMPTCGVACLSFETKAWKTITEKNAKLISFIFPKNFLV